MSSRIRKILNVGLAVVLIRAAGLTLALMTPTAAFDVGVPAIKILHHRTDNGPSHVASSGPTVMNTIAVWFAE